MGCCCSSDGDAKGAAPAVVTMDPRHSGPRVILSSFAISGEGTALASSSVEQERAYWEVRVLKAGTIHIGVSQARPRAELAGPVGTSGDSRAWTVELSATSATPAKEDDIIVSCAGRPCRGVVPCCNHAVTVRRRLNSSCWSPERRVLRVWWAWRVAHACKWFLTCSLFRVRCVVACCVHPVLWRSTLSGGCGLDRCCFWQGVAMDQSERPVLRFTLNGEPMDDWTLDGIKGTVFPSVSVGKGAICDVCFTAGLFDFPTPERYSAIIPTRSLI